MIKPLGLALFSALREILLEEQPELLAEAMRINVINGRSLLSMELDVGNEFLVALLYVGAGVTIVFFNRSSSHLFGIPPPALDTYLFF